LDNRQHIFKGLTLKTWVRILRNEGTERHVT